MLLRTAGYLRYSPAVSHLWGVATGPRMHASVIRHVPEARPSSRRQSEIRESGRSVSTYVSLSSDLSPTLTIVADFRPTSLLAPPEPTSLDQRWEGLGCGLCDCRADAPASTPDVVWSASRTLSARLSFLCEWFELPNRPRRAHSAKRACHFGIESRDRSIDRTGKLGILLLSLTDFVADPIR